jgi:hypothetical protein
MKLTTPWPVERVLFAIAGSAALTSAALGAFVSRWFLILAAVVGLNQWLYALVGWCPASVLLRRGLHLKSTLYPNDEPRNERSQKVVA